MLKRGFEFKNVDFFKSDATKFLIEGNCLIPPFTAIPGLGETAANDLVAFRGTGTIISIDEIAAGCPKVSKSHIEQLKKLGAFGDLPESAQLSLF